MGISSIRPLTIILAATVALAGCQSNRLGALQTQQAAPLNAAPTTSVSSGQLPPPAQPGTVVTSAGQFPEAPATMQDPNAPDMAGIDGEIVNADGTTTPSVQNVSVGGAPLTPNTMVGAWATKTGGSNCQLIMSLTKWNGAYRAASRGCPGAMASTSTWSIAGQKVEIKDTNGNQVATLFRSADKRFDGQTSDGKAVSIQQGY